ncbi:MAG: calcium-binding protein, partial [Alphaproteobacteria bacterium]
MVQVTIQNYDTDSSNILGVLDVDGLSVSGTPAITASSIGVSFTDGRAVALSGSFGPVVTYLSTGDDNALLASAGQIRIDAISVTISGTPWISLSQVNLTGTTILNYAQQSGAGDTSDLDDEIVNGAVALVFNGNDTIVSGVGDDNLRGYTGNDIVLGGDGDDTISGDDGNDEVNGNKGFDFVLGGNGADFVRGGQENDVVDGEDGDDWHVNGNIGDDDVYGGFGNDTVFGGQGNDWITGDTFMLDVPGGNDSILGNLGDDTIIGDYGNDTLAGNEGVDYFYIYTGDGNDRIVDFDVSNEIIVFESGLNGTGLNGSSVFSSLQARMTASQGGTLIDLGAGNSLFIQGVAPGQLTVANFE